MERYQDTLAELNRAIEQKPDDTRAIAQRGETYRQMEHFEAALADFDRAIELNPNYAWAIAHRGETYYLMKRYEEALADFNRAIDLNPDYTWAIAHRGVTYRFLGEAYYTKALADLDRAIERQPDYVWAIAYRCRVYELMKSYKKSLTDFDRAIAFDDTIFMKNWRIERGLILCYDGQYSQVIACCEQRLQEAPQDSTALYCIAVAKARWQGLDKAKSAIERARTALFSQWETEDRGDILYRLSGLAVLEGNCEQAWQYLREAIPINDEAIELVGHDPAWIDWRHHPKTQALLASLAVKATNCEELSVKQPLRRNFMQMNQNDWSIAQRAETLRLSGAYEQAIDIFKDLQKNYKYNAWVNAHLGTTYSQMMDYTKEECLLIAAITANEKYLWAHAQLGETYRLLAIVSKRNQKYITNAINHFKKALGSEIEKSNYAWALAHLGATYRLKMTGDINLLKTWIAQPQSQKAPWEDSKEEALKCLNRAVELIPTYAWAWGMRATVYRLAQDYENSFWDLGVETVIAPNLEVLQNSSSPVPFLESKRVNLYEHAFLSFYMIKKELDPEKKNLHYGRAIAYARQALIIRPGDLIAKLILILIEASQKKENQELFLSQTDDIKEKVKEFFKNASEFFNPCKKVLRYLIAAKQLSVENLESIRNEAGEEHKLTKLVLKDVMENPDLGVGEEPELWLWKNFALNETCSNVLSLLSDLSHILNHDPVIGEAEPYRKLAVIINPHYTLERLYQTPVFSTEERPKFFDNLSSFYNLSSK